MPQRYTTLFYTTIFLLALVSLGSRSSWAAKPQTGKATLDSTEVAIFAGGSFWCLEPVFEKLPGVVGVISGYTGGTDTMPTYETVIAGGTGHVEAVQVRFNSQTISYSKLLEAYWKNIDPTRIDGQFSDEGAQFRTVLYFQSETQKQLALASKKKLEQSQRFGKKKSIVTEIVPALTFYPAEANHQDFYKKNPGHYTTYRKFSGREKFFQKIWGTGTESKLHEGALPERTLPEGEP